MAYPPNAVLYDNANVSVVTSALSGATPSTGTLICDVALGVPMVDQLADICNNFKLRVSSLFNANGRPAFKLQTAAGVDYNMGLSFAQQGVQEGSTIKLVAS